MLTLQIVLLLQAQAFRFLEQLETSEFAMCEVSFQKRLCFERNEWQKQDRLSLTDSVNTFNALTCDEHMIKTEFRENVSNPFHTLGLTVIIQ